MSNPDKEPQPNKHTGARIAGVVTLLGAPIVFNVGCTNSAVVEQTNKPMPSATALEQFVKGITPEATSTPTPAEKPATPTTAPATATATVVEQKPLLPKYGSFLGDLTNKQTGAKEGMIVVASLPNNSFLVYFEALFSSNRKSQLAFISVAENIQGRNFEVINQPQVSWRIQATVNEDGTLTGRVINGRNLSKPGEEFNFQKLELTGNGRTAVIQDMTKVKAALFGTSLDQTKLDDLQVTIDKLPAN